jgi:hypothetical protein
MFKEFIVRDVLNVDQTKSVVAKADLVEGEIPYVTRTVSDNGYMGTCGNIDKINKGNCITIGAETGVAFYQPDDFVAGNKVYRLSREGLDEKEYLFLASVLNMQTKNYSYSNARIPEKIKAEIILLPVIESSDIDHEYTVDDIDWQYMRDYIIELEHDRITELDAYLQATGLNDYELTEDDKKILSLSAKRTSDEARTVEDDSEDEVKFGKFIIGEIFDSQNGDTDLQKIDVNGKGVPIITSGVQNNGILGLSDRKAKIINANTITVDMFGNAYYRDFAYKMVTHARVFSLKLKEGILTDGVGLYICSKLKHLTELFSYNNMCSFNKIKSLSIELPIKSDGTPDFDYMERYIRAIEKVVIADVVKYKDKVIEETRKAR